MVICLCHRVSDRDIARAAREGCASFEELQFELAVATGCGHCHDCARETFDHHADQVRRGKTADTSGACAMQRAGACSAMSLRNEAAQVAAA
jgi:bacterioferritin-associated ferredoxin